MAKIITEEYVIRLTWAEKSSAATADALKLQADTLEAIEGTIEELVQDQPGIVVEVEHFTGDE